MADEQELTLQEKLTRVNGSLNDLRATEAACNEILKEKRIKIINLADTSEDPLALTLNGNATVAVIQPILRGVDANREQLVTIKEQLLAALEAELAVPKA